MRLHDYSLAKKLCRGCGTCCSITKTDGNYVLVHKCGHVEVSQAITETLKNKIETALTSYASAAVNAATEAATAAGGDVERIAE